MSKRARSQAVENTAPTFIMNNANSYATIPNNLNALTEGNNSLYKTATTWPSNLNNQDVQTLFENFQRKVYQKYIASSSSQSQGGTTPNIVEYTLVSNSWTKTTDWKFIVPIRLTYTSPKQNQQKALKFYDPLFRWNFQSLVTTYITNGKPLTELAGLSYNKLTDFNFTHFSMCDVFRNLRLEFAGGITPLSVFEYSNLGIKNTMLTPGANYRREDIARKGAWGMPFSHLNNLYQDPAIPAKLFGDEGVEIDYKGQTSDMEDEWIKAWSSTLNQLSYANGATIANKDTNTDIWTRDIWLPLSFEDVYNLFKGNHFLPPGFPMKLTLEIESGPVTVLYGQNENGLSPVVQAQIINPASIFISTWNHTVTPQQMSIVNQLITQNPLSFSKIKNILTNNTQTTGDTYNQVIEFQITQNQQLPKLCRLFCYTSVDILANNIVKNSLYQLGSPTGTASNQIVPADVQMIQIENYGEVIKLMDFTSQPGVYDGLLSEFDFTLIEENKNTLKEYQLDGMYYSSFTNIKNPNRGYYIDIPISPDQETTMLNVQPLNQGASILTIKVTLKQPMPMNGIRWGVISYYNETLKISGNNNVSITSWPNAMGTVSPVTNVDTQQNSR